MAITYVAGTSATGAASVATITFPAGIQAGDVMVMAVTWKRGTGTYFYVPAGWTLWERAEGATVTYQNILLTKEALGNESGTNLTVNDGATASQDIAVAVSIYRGAHVVPRSRNMVTANAGGTDASVECTDPGGNQTGDRRIVAAMARGSLNGPSGSPSFTAVTAGFTIRAQATSTQASAQNAAVAIADGTGTGTVSFTASASTYSVGSTVWLREGTPTAHSIFTSQTPAGTNSSDGSPYTLATTFYPTTDGFITAARWRFPTTLPTGAAAGSVTAGVWEYTTDTTGTLLATTSFLNPTAGAWNTADFATPIKVSEGKAYVVGIYTPDRYVGTTNGFTGVSITNGYLVAPQTGADPVGLGSLFNGRLHSGGASLTWPETSFSGSNYFVDVVFTAGQHPAPNRLYLTSAAPEYTPATIRGSWTNATTTSAWKLGKRPEGEATSSARADTVATNPNNVLLGRWVSHGAYRSGTIAGSMNWCIGVLESNAAMNAFFRFHVYVLAGDTDTVRGVLRTEIVNSTEWISTSPVGRTGNNWSMTSTAIQAGDRLVIEVGYSAQNAVTTSYTGTLYFGTQGAIDLSLADPNVSSLPGWVEFTDGDGLWWDAAANLTDDFNDGTLDTTDRWADTWVSGGVTPIETGGRCRIYCNTNYAGILSRPWLHFRDTSVSWEMAILANGATASSECYFKGSVDSDTVPGTYLGWYLNLKTGELRANQAVDFWDAAATVLTWNATNHRWLRIREANGTVYWETSANGTAWTVQRSAPTPHWCSYKDVALSFDAHRDAGTQDFFEIDNVNTGPPSNQSYNPSIADTADLVDAATAVEVKTRAAGTDTADVVDTVTVAEAKARTVGPDGAGLVDAVTAAEQKSRTVGPDTADVVDAVTAAEAKARTVGPDTAAIADAVTAVLGRSRTAADGADLVDAVTAAEQKARAAADTAAIVDSATAGLGRPRTAADTAGLVDAVTAATTTTGTVADTAPVVDTASAVLGRSRTAADGADLVDAVTAATAVARTVADTADLVDAVTAVETEPRTAADTAAIADAVTVGLGRTRVAGIAVADTAGLVDAIELSSGARTQLGDTAPIADAVTVTANRVRGIADGAGLADASGAATGGFRSIPDAAGLLDTVARTSARARGAADTAALVDTVTAVAGKQATAGDTAPVVDTVFTTEARTRQPGDGAELVDASAATVGRSRSIPDAAGVDDAVVAVLSTQRVPADVVDLVDAVVRTYSPGRAATDIAGIGDTVHVQIRGLTVAGPHRITVTRPPGQVVATRPPGRVVDTTAPARVRRST